MGDRLQTRRGAGRQASTGRAKAETMTVRVDKRARSKILDRALVSIVRTGELGLNSRNPHKYSGSEYPTLISYISYRNIDSHKFPGVY